MKKFLNLNLKYFFIIFTIFLIAFFFLINNQKTDTIIIEEATSFSEAIILPIEDASENNAIEELDVKEPPPEILPEEVTPKINTEIDSKETSDKKIILHDVPFTSQAPLANWEDERQQDGCEEASVLMAVKWGRQESLNNQEALQEILAASDYILEKYGEYRDTDLDDVLNWLIKDYFKYEKAEIKKDVTINDLVIELENNRVIIIPANGQALKNPNFTAPGPLNHMLLIRGYDPIKKVFITNDPGTRNGNLYEYPENVLYAALRTYPTGYKEENLNPRKDVIIFWR